MQDLKENFDSVKIDCRKCAILKFEEIKDLSHFGLGPLFCFYSVILLRMVATISVVSAE